MENRRYIQTCLPTLPGGGEGSDLTVGPASRPHYARLSSRLQMVCIYVKNRVAPQPDFVRKLVQVYVKTTLFDVLDEVLKDSQNVSAEIGFFYK
jgi:hypothetical protein